MIFSKNTFSKGQKPPLCQSGRKKRTGPENHFPAQFAFLYSFYLVIPVYSDPAAYAAGFPVRITIAAIRKEPPQNIKNSAAVLQSVKEPRLWRGFSAIIKEKGE